MWKSALFSRNHARFAVIKQVTIILQHFKTLASVLWRNKVVINLFNGKIHDWRHVYFINVERGTGFKCTDFRAKFTGVPQSLSKPPQRIAGSGFEIDSYPHPGKLETKHLRSLEFINKFHWWPYRMTPFGDREMSKKLFTRFSNSLIIQLNQWEIRITSHAHQNRPTELKWVCM